jgi:myo-inositol-1(or 4)-monophosphatase
MVLSRALSDTARFALDIAREAGELIMQILPASAADKDVQYKTPTDLVTRADHEAERLIIGRIRARYPGHDILGEEGGVEAGSAPKGICTDGGRPRWIVDPVDGTANFARGIPWFAVSIAFEEGGVTQCGVVVVPPIGECFVAERGRGAYQVGKDGALVRLGASQTAEIRNAIVATGVPSAPARDPHAPTVAPVMIRAMELRVMGAASIHLAYVAAGRLDVFWEAGLHAWDVAAGILLVEEAGGRVTDWTGRPLRVVYDRLLASNGRLHQTMVELLQERHG